jgi:hypothetical protein
MQKDTMKRNRILFILFFLYVYTIRGQELKLFTPILISNLQTEIIDGERVNKVVLDYYNPDVNKMETFFFKYSSDDNTLYLFNSEYKEFRNFLNFNKIGKKVSSENFLGIFRYFNLIQESEKCFKALSTTGNYPSHFEKINSIEVLEKDKKFLILKINYSDVYDFKGYGILVLQDYKYTR